MSFIQNHINRTNEWFGQTRIAKYFEMDVRGTTLFREFGGATVTFMTMAYILAVNPRILADSGGPCVPDPPEMGGIFGPNYNDCLERVSALCVR